MPNRILHVTRNSLSCDQPPQAYRVYFTSQQHLYTYLGIRDWVTASGTSERAWYYGDKGYFSVAVTERGVGELNKALSRGKNKAKVPGAEARFALAI